MFTERKRKKIEATLGMGLPTDVAEDVSHALASSGVYYEDLFTTNTIPSMIR